MEATTTSHTLRVAEAGYHSRSRRHLVAGQFVKNRGAVMGLVALVGLVVTAFLAPIVAPYDPIAPSPDILEPPSPAHRMGTDRFGRDILSRIIFGARASLRIGLIAVGIGSIAGLSLGLLGGYAGGYVDSAIVMLIDVMLSFPTILLALIIVTVLGPGLSNLMIAVGVATVPNYGRVVRGAVVVLREEIYVLSARAVGCGDMRIIFRHILPNVIPLLVVLATLNIPLAILSASGLSFVGLGAEPPTPEWGVMVSEGRSFLRSGWWISTYPGLAIMLAVLSMNLLGDGLRDALDPRMRE